MCGRNRWPFVLIVQPRRYCELEIATEPVSGADLDSRAPQLALPAIRRIHGLAAEALAASTCPPKRRYQHIHATGGTVCGLDLEPAQRLASQVFTILANRQSYMGGTINGER